MSGCIKDDDPGVVYRLKCSDCGKAHIRQTGRTASSKVRKPTAYITAFHFRKNSQPDFGKVEFVDYGRHAIKSGVKEELYINAQEDAMKEDRELELTPISFWVFS